LSLFGHDFYSRAPIEKYILSHEANQFFCLPKNNSRNHDKNSAYRYLQEIPFVPQRGNGPLGVNRYTLEKGHCKKHLVVFVAFCTIFMIFSRILYN